MKLRMTREIYLAAHKGAVKVSHKGSEAVAYAYTNTAGMPAVMIFVGKQQKPAAHYHFKTVEKREQYVRGFFESQAEVCTRKAARKAERKAFVHSVKVGDLFRTSWGYEQTNVEFFECVEVKGAFVVVRQIGAESTETAWMQGTCSPKAGQFIGEPIRKKVLEGNSLKMSDWGRYARPCSAETKAHWSSYH